jgi:multiple sugar transport system substrate-binding protein
MLVSGMLAMASGKQDKATEEKAEVLKIVAPGILRTVLTTGNGGDVVADFEAETGIKVEWLILPWQDVTARLFREASLSSTEIFGVVNNGEIAPKMAGIFEPVNDYMNANPIEDFEKDFYKGMVVSSTFDGKIYGIPFRNAVSGLHYNELFYKENGLGGPPKTVEELIDNCLKTTYTRSDGTKVYGYSMPGAKSVNNVLFWSRGWDGDVINSDYKVVCNEPPMVKALETLSMFKAKGAIPEAFLSITDDDRYTWIQQGRVAHDFNDFGSTEVYNDPKQSKVPGTWKTAAFPISEELKGKMDVAPAPVGGWLFSIPASHKYKQSAWDFIAFISKKDSTLRAALNGNGPLRKSTYQDPKYKEMIPWAEIEMKAVEFGRPEFPGWDESKRSRDLWSDYCKTALLGKATAQEAMDKAAEEIIALLKKHGLGGY